MIRLLRSLFVGAFAAGLGLCAAHAASSTKTSNLHNGPYKGQNVQAERQAEQHYVQARDQARQWRTEALKNCHRGNRAQGAEKKCERRVRATYSRKLRDLQAKESKQVLSAAGREPSSRK